MAMMRLINPTRRSIISVVLGASCVMISDVCSALYVATNQYSCIQKSDDFHTMNIANKVVW